MLQDGPLAPGSCEAALSCAEDGQQVVSSGPVSSSSHPPTVCRAVTGEEVEPGLLVYPDYCNSIFYMFNIPTAARMVEEAKVRR